MFGPKGHCTTDHYKDRTVHSANGLLIRDNPRTQRNTNVLVRNLDVNVMEEFGTVPGDLFHADALRKTYGPDNM